MAEKQIGPEQEGFYDILQNGAGDLLISIRARAGEPDHPQIVYDGGKHATLYRRPDEVILLDYLNDDILESLKKSEYIIIAEADFEKEKIVRDYQTRVKIIKNNPFCDHLK